MDITKHIKNKKNITVCNLSKNSHIQSLLGLDSYENIESLDNYDPRSFAELVRQLEQLILQLNFSYQQDNADEQTRRAFFFG